MCFISLRHKTWAKFVVVWFVFKQSSWSFTRSAWRASLNDQMGRA